ncbi:MAG: membrane protein insertase YidC [Deltaproteobacteria bacterium]|nr:membrane protein insertase YidC [Deltaproteobacteria bacterium]
MERRWISILVITFALFITIELLFGSGSGNKKEETAKVTKNNIIKNNVIKKNVIKKNVIKKNVKSLDEKKQVKNVKTPDEKKQVNSKKTLTERIVDVNGPDYKIEFTTIGGRLKSYVLSNYLDTRNKPVELVQGRNIADYPLNFKLEGGEQKLDYLSEYNVATPNPGEIDFSWSSGNGLEVSKKISVGSEKDVFNYNIVVKNSSNSAKNLGTPIISISGFRNFEGNGGGGCASGCSEHSDGRKLVDLASPKFLVGDELIEAQKDDDIRELRPVQGDVKWIGIDRHYFMLALISKEGGYNGIVNYKLKNDRMVVGELRLPELKLGPGEEKSFEFRIFAGPKYRDLLKKVNAGLDKSIDFGWFWFIAIPMLVLMQFFYSVFGNYGIAIILLTIVIKIILLPITQKMYRSMNRMKKIQPKIKALKEKLGDDKEAFQREQMELMKREGVNPLGGCLPMFIQMPVYIALWRALFSAVELYQEPMGLWIKDLSAPDPYYVLPILLVIAMVISQRMTPTTGDDIQAKMMQWMMPIVFGFMMFMLPSGLVLYILANSILQIIHQGLMLKMPEPEYTPAKDGIFYKLMNKVQASSEQMQRLKGMEEEAKKRREERLKRIADKRKRKKEKRENR